jgi:ubiquinone/menaquinone biosynthesis C-methylase UbiE
MRTNLEAKLFNRRASDSRAKSDEVINALAVKPGHVIADIGSGGGFFTLRFAETVGRDGYVYAVDTNRKLLDYIQQQAEAKGFENIVSLCVDEADLTLPINTFDLLFLRNAYHHLSNRIQYFKHLQHALKPGGRIAILEYTRGGLFRRLFRHYVPQATIISEMQEAGYQVVDTFDFLLDQSFTIFQLHSHRK